MSTRDEAMKLERLEIRKKKVHRRLRKENQQIASYLITAIKILMDMNIKACFFYSTKLEGRAKDILH